MVEQSTGIAVRALDHVVLTVADVMATVEFYCKVLGMRHEVFVSPKNPDVER
jgi:predicted enzyme related to lactoylglutathione lyase